ncbi:hypothetical protein B0H10DRAFT_2436884 [Mycena sp. CBHHK59/15]|nr:hypothetical protein B0H10DRAFT_2436884 [Mycena sp. CBHHK59/15]
MTTINTSRFISLWRHFSNAEEWMSVPTQSPLLNEYSKTLNPKYGLAWTKNFTLTSLDMLFPHPSVSFQHSLSLPKNHTQNALINWALQVIIACWKKEAELLLNPIFGFVRERRQDEAAERFSWFDVLNWSMTKNQEIIAVNAPAMFACMTSVVVNNRAQKTLNRAARATSNLPPAEPDSDDTDDEDQDVTLSTGVPPKMRRDPWLGTTITILMLLYFRYRYAIIFPTFIGLFLFTCNAHRDVFTLLSRIGLSVSYSMALQTLHAPAADSATQLQLYGAAVAVGQPMFLLLFDNINKMQQAWQQVLGRRDTLTSGTAVTLIGLEDVTEEAMDSKPLLENLAAKKRRKLTVEQLLCI